MFKYVCFGVRSTVDERKLVDALRAVTAELDESPDVLVARIGVSGDARWFTFESSGLPGGRVLVQDFFTETMTGVLDELSTGGRSGPSIAM